MVEPSTVWLTHADSIFDRRETSTDVENDDEEIEEMDEEVAPKPPREEERPSGHVFLGEFQVLICID